MDFSKKTQKINRKIKRLEKSKNCCRELDREISFNSIIICVIGFILAMSFKSNINNISKLIMTILGFSLQGAGILSSVYAIIYKCKKLYLKREKQLDKKIENEKLKLDEIEQEIYNYIYKNSLDTTVKLDSMPKNAQTISDCESDRKRVVHLSKGVLGENNLVHKTYMRSARQNKLKNCKSIERVIINNVSDQLNV